MIRALKALSLPTPRYSMARGKKWKAYRSKPRF